MAQSEQELNMQRFDVSWVEERSFVFDCVVRILRSTVNAGDDPLAALAAALLFHNLGEIGTRNAALSRVEDELQLLPDVLDSGLQLRDCLLASGYYYVARKVCRDMLAVDHIVLQRINFAAANKWFEDSRLAAIVALISNEVRVGSEAKRYLRDRVDAWLDNNYVLGVLHYCLVSDEQESGQLSSYLSKTDWSSANITTLSWALLSLGKLRKRGYELHRAQYYVARRILEILGDSDLVQAVVGQKPNPDVLTMGSMTAFDFAFATYALNAEGFDSVIGVRRNQREALEALFDLQHRLAQGGTVVSKRWLVIFQLGLIGFLSLISWEVIRFAGLESLLQVVLEIGVVAILSAIGRWVFKKGLPSTGAALAIFGDAVLQDQPEGEIHGYEN